MPKILNSYDSEKEGDLEDLNSHKSYNLDNANLNEKKKFIFWC